MPLPPNVSAELQRDMARLGFVMGQIRDIEDAHRKRLEQQPETGPHAMVRLLNRVVGVGIETADMLVHEVLSRPMRDRKRWRYAGRTGSPTEGGPHPNAYQRFDLPIRIPVSMGPRSAPLRAPSRCSFS